MIGKRRPKAKTVSIDSLLLDPNNARRRDDRAQGALEKSVGQFGAARSLVMDADGMIRAGNGTLEAARAAGITEAIVIETDGSQLVVVKRPDWTAEQALAYALSDNRTSELSEWDADALAASLAKLESTDFEFDAGMEFDFDGLSAQLVKVRAHERRLEPGQDTDDEPPPVHLSMFSVGEEIVLKDCVFKIADIDESHIRLEPVLPDDKASPE